MEKVTQGVIFLKQGISLKNVEEKLYNQHIEYEKCSIVSTTGKWIELKVESYSFDNNSLANKLRKVIEEVDDRDVVDEDITEYSQIIFRY